MTLTINIPDEIRPVLEQRAAASGKALADYIQECLIDTFDNTDDKTDREPEAPRNVRRRSPEEFELAIRAIVSMCPKNSLPLDVSRDSIY